ncbi:TonB-dependent receptor [Methylosinus sp. LW4]|uniref:TonB-dependent receptor n=1 Tax=Methylosinus sp. LW4 TaxID=136993 RepID=UPI000370CE8E|nr:TonB-dependent receptor [Methylosinus sp. LW4]
MNRNDLLRGAGALALLLAASPMRAQEELPDIDISSATRTSVKLQEAPAAVDVAVSDDDKEKGKGTLLTIEQHNSRRLADALTESPSLFFRGSAFGNTTPGSGQGGFSMRGIAGNRSRIMIDGQTLNSGYSNGVNWSSVMMSDVERIEVVPGAFSALWGGDAMGGVVNVISKRPTKRELTGEAGVTAGSPVAYFANVGYRDRFDNGLGIAVALGHIGNHSFIGDFVTKTAAAGAAGTPVVGAIPTTDQNGNPSIIIGDKGRRPWDQQNGNLRLYYDYSADTKLSAGVSYDRYHTYYTHNNDYIAGRGGSFLSGAANNTGVQFSVAPTDFVTLQPSEETSLRGFGRFETKIADGLTLEGDVGYATLTNWYVNFISGKSYYDGGVGQISTSPNTRFNSSMQLHAQLLEYNDIILGGSFEESTLARHNDDTWFWRNPDSRVATSYSANGDSTMTSVYFQDKVSPLKDFQLPYVRAFDLYFGGRYDMWEAHGANFQSPTPYQPTLLGFYRSNSLRQENSFSPKFSAVYEPFEWVTLHGSVGTAFHPPTLSQLYSTAFTTKTGPVGVRTTEADPNLKSEKLFGWEIGANFRLPTRTKIQATYFENDLRDLIYQQVIIQGTANDLNRNVNVGRAYVHGIEATVRQEVTEELALFGVVTRQDPRVTKNDSQIAMVGKVLGDVPSTSFVFGGEWKWREWAASAEVKYTGKIFGNSDTLNQGVANGVFGTYDPYTLVNAKISYKFDENVTFSVAGNNLLNQRYFQYYLQPGLTITSSLSVRY